MKPFVKRQKNDAADAEAIAEAALRPTMRFVAVKTEDQQARAMLFRTRQMFVGQRTQMINALRGHLAEHGLVAARGPAHLKRLADAIADDDTTLPDEVRELGRMYLEQIEGLSARIAELDAKDEMCCQGGGSGAPRTNHAGGGSCHGAGDRDICA